MSAPISAGQDISEREAEVLALVADRLTNAQIASRLFISIRTVETHVSSLLRKLGASNRRELAAAAAGLRTPDGETGAVSDAARLPTALTPFVGRVAERAGLAAALTEHRLVTAVGPGGIGKTRLALAVAAEVSDRFPDGVWYVDLVPVTDPVMLPRALADELGLGEQPGRSAEDTIASRVGERRLLLVLDNCEHLLDSVVAMLERLLLRCPRVAVLATSRARLLVPFEYVFAVPAMSLPDADGPGDAVALFASRAAASGATFELDQDRVAAICRALDGMALAIELAAARLPASGLDGLEAGLADRLRLLVGGHRADQRHRSLRSTLDWSYALLDAGQQALLRRASVFAAPFTVDAASALLAGWPPVEDVPGGLAALAEQSLLLASYGADGTRYRALETIRQYGADRLAGDGELDDAQLRHLRWCLAQSAALASAADPESAGWRAAFDSIADEMRAALGWAAQVSATRPDVRADAFRLAITLAELSFVRGIPRETQRRYEQAAEYAADAAAAAAALHSAAGAATAIHSAHEALRLHRAAAEAAVRAGQPPLAAYDLAQAAELINRAPGMMAVQPGPEVVDALLAQARELAGGDARAEARVLVADAYRGAESDPLTAELSERAVELAQRAGDPQGESAALDMLTAVYLARGEVRAALDSTLRRTELVAALPLRADVAGLEVLDAYQMAAECAIAAGDLRTARRLAEQVRDLPFQREEIHLGAARLMVVSALAGEWPETLALAERFQEGWDRAGRPTVGNLAPSACSASLVFALRGDDEARQHWLDIVVKLRASVDAQKRAVAYGPLFDAIVHLHRGDPAKALAELTDDPADFRHWYTGLWRQWYAALWAETAVLAGDATAEHRLHRAATLTADNPIAAAIIERATALHTGDRQRLLAAADALSGAGCRYESARTLVLAGGAERAAGAAALAAMGATPMAEAAGASALSAQW